MFKKLFKLIKAYMCVPIYHIDKWVYTHIKEHDGMYLKIHKSYAWDLQQELNTALLIRKNRKLVGEYKSIFFYSLDWDI